MKSEETYQMSREHYDDLFDILETDEAVVEFINRECSLAVPITRFEIIN